MPLSLGFRWVGVELFAVWVCIGVGWIQTQDSWDPGPKHLQQHWRLLTEAGQALPKGGLAAALEPPWAGHQD